MKLFKNRGFFRKLLGYQCIIYLFLIAFIFSVISFLEKKFWSEYLLNDAIKTLKMLNQDVVRTFGRGFGKELIEEEVKKILKSNFHIIFVSVVDSNGNVLFKYSEENIPKAGLDRYSKKNDDVMFRVVKKNGNKYFDILVPFVSPGQTKFIVRYIVFFPVLDKQIRNINLVLLISAIISFILIFAFSYVFAKKIIVPIEVLKEKANAIKDGNFNISIPKLEEEFDELGKLIEMMAKEIRNKHEELLLRNKNLESALEQVLFLQKQVLNYEKMAALGKISAGMSHEIDNPLGIILGHAELILEELPHDSPIKEDVEIIIKEGLRIKKILRSLLDFAKPRESKLKKIELSKFLKEILDNFSFQKIFKKITLEYLPVEEVDVIADEEKLHQVVVNVILNAIHAMPEGGKLEVKVIKEENHAIISITDHGVGIPEEIMPKVFDPFFSTKKDGTGLGLAISKMFIEEMGGEIKIQSKVSEGTTVIIKLSVA
jgi:two-component system NtrC family sensor kinase